MNNYIEQPSTLKFEKNFVLDAHVPSEGKKGIPLRVSLYMDSELENDGNNGRNNDTVRNREAFPGRL
jgi:hypothetical protein